jgi:hypothetical protein
MGNGEKHGERGIHGERGRLEKRLSLSPSLPQSSPVFLGCFLDLPPALADEVLKKVLATATVRACNLAFRDVVERVKAEAGGDAAKAQEMALHHVVPGVIPEPSGVSGVLRAQEAGCSYILAS